jgi:CubicO group peptidase (beta-lactamase class C family)
MGRVALRIGALFLTVAAGVLAEAGVRAADPPPLRPLEKRVDSYLQPYVEGGNFSGAVLVARDGRLLASRAYGMANHELSVPNTPRTRFHIASVSKPFTAAAILLLEARGRLSTSDPVSRWIPDLPNGDRITLNHLLTHTSGIANINDAPFYAVESTKPHTAEDLVRLIRGLTAEFAPGERYEYSNSNYNILAYVIERASRRTYGDFLKEAIFDPLGMDDTGHDDSAQALIASRASGYVPAGLSGVGNAPWLDWSVKTGNGSLFSTIEDLWRFDQALAAGKLLPRDAMERILRGGKGNVYGWFVGERLGRKRMAANGRSPGFTASLERYPDDKVTVIVLSNLYSTAAQSPIAVDLAAMALDQPYAAPDRITPVPVTKARLEALEGRYIGGEDFFFPGVSLTVASAGGHLAMHWSSGADSILVPVADGEFLDRSFWARVRFVEDAQWGASRLLWTYDGKDYPASRPAAPR